MSHINNSSFDLIDLDFISLKNNFKNFLRSQPQFKDYDFEGSNINVLLDILAYNTYKNSFYTNMLFSEGFLDTAQLKSSVVSHAKELNYTPRSMRSSKATIKVDFQASGENQPYIIPKGSSISSLIKSSNFTFTIPENLTVSSVDTSFSFETDIYEGVYVQDTYIFNQTGETIPRFNITNKNIDTDSLSVIVYEDNSTNGQIYNITNTLLDLDFKSQVYFLQGDNESYEVYFGDDILGKRPKDFSTIVLDYRVTEGPLSDSAQNFVLNFNPTGNNSELLSAAVITTISVARGGANAETTESIRYYAPRHFQVQERTVTESDYETALKVQFPEINAVHAFGGENLNPPQFGRVFVAVDISNVMGLPDSKVREYTSFIKSKAPFSIEPMFIGPDYTYLNIDALVRYNINVTKVSRDTISTLVSDAIISYNEEELDNFHVTHRNSKLACEIDETDISIISSNLDVVVYKKYNAKLNERQSFVLDFEMQLKNDVPKKGISYPAGDENTFYSSPFRFNGEISILEDDGDGKIRMVKTDGELNFVIYNVGVIDYETGIVSIDNFIVDFYVGDAINFYVEPRDLDISVKNNTILTIEDAGINITVEEFRV